MQFWYCDVYFKRLSSDSPGLLTECPKIRINNKGRLTPVADAKTLKKIILLLPGRKAQQLRVMGAERLFADEAFEGMPAAFKYLSESDRADFAKKSLDLQVMVDKHKLASDKHKLYADKQHLKVDLKRKRIDNLLSAYKSVQDFDIKTGDGALREIRDKISW